MYMAGILLVIQAGLFTVFTYDVRGWSRTRTRLLKSFVEDDAIHVTDCLKVLLRMMQSCSTYVD